MHLEVIGATQEIRKDRETVRCHQKPMVVIQEVPTTRKSKRNKGDTTTDRCKDFVLLIHMRDFWTMEVSPYVRKISRYHGMLEKFKVRRSLV